MEVCSQCHLPLTHSGWLHSTYDDDGVRQEYDPALEILRCWHCGLHYLVIADGKLTPHDEQAHCENWQKFAHADGTPKVPAMQLEMFATNAE